MDKLRKGLKKKKKMNCFMFSDNLTKAFSQILYSFVVSLKYDDYKWISVDGKCNF